MKESGRKRGKTQRQNNNSSKPMSMEGIFAGNVNIDMVWAKVPADGRHGSHSSDVCRACKCTFTLLSTSQPKQRTKHEQSYFAHKM